MTWKKNYTAAAVLRALAWKPCRAALLAPRSPASLKPAATLRSAAGASSSAAAQPCQSRSPPAGARYAPSAAGTRVGPARHVLWHQQGGLRPRTTDLPAGVRVAGTPCQCINFAFS